MEDPMSEGNNNTGFTFRVVCRRRRRRRTRRDGCRDDGDTEGGEVVGGQSNFDGDGLGSRGVAFGAGGDGAWCPGHYVFIFAAAAAVFFVVCVVSVCVFFHVWCVRVLHSRVRVHGRVETKANEKEPGGARVALCMLYVVGTLCSWSL